MVKLDERTAVPDELKETHNYVISFRQNFTAHSGAVKYEAAQVVLLLNPLIRDQKDSMLLMRESLQPEAYIRYDPTQNFSTLVERVREYVLEKIGQLNQKIFAEEINPKGSAYWYLQKK